MSVEINPLTNYDDVIDSRDIITRIEYLEEQAEEADADWDELSAEEQAELTALRTLAEEGSNNAEDWSYGATLIRDSYFQTYAEELAEDLGLLTHEDQWPYTCIDWEAAAQALQQDYTNITFAGVDYWVR